MMCLVVQNHHALVSRDAFAQFRSRVECLCTRNRRPHPIVSFRLFLATLVVVKPVNVHQVKCAARRRAARFILQHDGQIPIAAPCDWNQRVIVENILAAFRWFEIRLQSLENREVWCDDHEMFCHRRIAFAQRVEITPHNRQTHHFSFARTCRQLERIFCPTIIVWIHAERRRLCAWAAEFSDQRCQRTNAAHFVEVNQRLHRLALAEVITKWNTQAAACFNQMIPTEPMMQQFPRRVGCARIIRLAPLLHMRAQRLRDGDFGWATAFLGLRRLVALRPRPVLIRLFVRSEQRFKRGNIYHRLTHTFTSTVMLVSQPNTSTTLTHAVYLPGLGYLSKPASLTVFNERSFRVR